jgi:hypothetical protein
MRIQFCRDRVGQLAAFVALCLALAGCGGSANNGCFIQSINVSPGSATVDHTAAPPGNTQQFAAFAASVPQGCEVAQSNLTTVIWSVSDPVNVSIGATPGPSFGVASCKAATSGAVTITGTLNQADLVPVKATASLTCN